MPRLTHLDWPDHGRPAIPPALTAPELSARLAAVRAAMALRGLDALVIYGDREHAANLHWVTGFDPRFEEAFLVLTAGAATLAVGNECLPYAQTSPLVADETIAVLLCPSLSLVSQPRGGLTIAQVIAQTVPAGAAVGVAGWKYFGADEVADPATALDLPVFLADPLRDRAGRVVAAADLFMHPAHGLRARVDAAEIARLEFANAMAVRAIRRLVGALAEGAVDFDVVEAAGIGGLPLGCHGTFACGERAFQGMSSPTGQVLRRGSPISFNVCHWGANICRAGWLAQGPGDLPAAAQDYLDRFAGPYVAAMSSWCGLMRPGVAGGAVQAAMDAALPADPFGVTLNPGHLIGLDEWLSSPIFPGSDIPLASGMALQMDVIPSHPVYGSTRMEDGYVIADGGLQADLQARFPAVAARCAARARVMREVIGMDVPEALLPLADTCGIVAPFLLAADKVIVL
jgi:Xaa-Pro aminopeptidase